jgi:hypothetical protein
MHMPVGAANLGMLQSIVFADARLPDWKKGHPEAGACGKVTIKIARPTDECSS